MRIALRNGCALSRDAAEQIVTAVLALNHAPLNHAPASGQTTTTRRPDNHERHDPDETSRCIRAASHRMSGMRQASDGATARFLKERDRQQRLAPT